MNLQEQSDLVLTFAQVLQVNGQCTEETVLATERLSDTLGVRAAMIPTLARYSTNPFVQPLCAALLAGIIGALAVRYQLSSTLRLIAVCPCMIQQPADVLLSKSQ